MESNMMEDVFLQDDLGPTIAEHASQCSHLFKKYMAMPKVTPDPTLMDDQLARFTLWASNMEVFGPLNVSLDYRLRYSRTVVDIIHQLLDVICNALVSLKPVDDPPETPTRKKRRVSKNGNAQVTSRVEDDSSDTDNDEDQAQKNVSVITFTIGGTVSRLLRLSNAIRKSAKGSRTTKIREYKDDEEANIAIAELRVYTECYVRFRFPQVSEALCSALVEANTLRLRRLFYQRSHRRRIALTVQRPQAGQRNLQLEKAPQNFPVIRFIPNAPPKKLTIIDENPPKAALSPVPPLTYATTARQTAVKALYADSTVEVSRAKSVLVNNKLSFPPVPTTSECPYCGVIVEFKNSLKSATWNDHVIRDLEPFVCVFTHCTESSQQEPGSLTFETSKAWLSHMQNAHGYAWECRAPSHSPIVFEQEHEFQDHACHEHKVPEAHVATLSGAARRPVPEKILQCPFGDDFSDLENAESSIVFANESLYLHVATHMKEIALLALQKLPSDDNANFEDVASDAPLNDEGLAKLRGSMYSVLDDESLDFLEDAEDGAGLSLEEGIAFSVGRLELEEKDAAGLTQLHHAVRDKNLPLTRSLIEQGANLRTRTNRGETILHHASLNSDTDMMEFLLRCGAEEMLAWKNDDGQTPLHYAAKEGFADGIHSFVKLGALIEVHDNYGLSPFLWAVISGGIVATELLLRLGADSNSISADGKSALHWAASLGHSPVVRVLVSAGADVMSMTQKTQVVPLQRAAACGDVHAVQCLLDSGADVNHRDCEGWSALHMAAEQGHCDVVRALTDSGADVNAISSYGTSPLHCAANGGHNIIVIHLLGSGADVFASTCHGWTALHHAAFMGFSDVVNTLLTQSSQLRLLGQDNHGWSALHLAVHGRHLDTVRILLRFAPWRYSLQCDDDGHNAGEWLEFEFDSHAYKTIANLAFGKSRCCRAVTKLRQAVFSNNIVLAEFLLRHGYHVNDTDSGNRTALYYAAKKGLIPILNMLIEHGADPNILPVGRRMWSDFISDHAILNRLRKAGYTEPVPDPRTNEQLKLSLGHARLSAPDLQPPEPAGATAGKKEEAPGKRKADAKFWRWLRRR